MPELKDLKEVLEKKEASLQAGRFLEGAMELGRGLIVCFYNIGGWRGGEEQSWK